MKKLIAMLLALAMCFTLVACGGPPANGDENGESGSTPTRLNLAHRYLRRRVLRSRSGLRSGHL